MQNTSEFESRFLGKRITKISAFNVNNPFWVFDLNSLAATDGGIEIEFEDEKMVVGWHHELEMYLADTVSVKSLLGPIPHYQILSAELPLLKKLVGSKLVSLKAKWDWYQDLNDDLEPFGEKQYVPKDFFLTFQDGQILQIATVSFDIENDTIHNPVYDSCGQILISVGKVFEIGYEKGDDN